MLDLQNSHGGSGQISLSDYYKGGAYVISSVSSSSSTEYNNTFIHAGPPYNYNNMHYWRVGTGTSSSAARTLALFSGFSVPNQWDFGNTDNGTSERDNGYITTSTAAPNSTSNGMKNSGKITSFKLFDTSQTEIAQTSIQTTLYSPFETSASTAIPYTAGGNGSCAKITRFGHNNYRSQFEIEGLYGNSTTLYAANIGGIEIVYADHIDAYNPTGRTALWFTGTCKWERLGSALYNDGYGYDYYDFKYTLSTSTSTAANAGVPTSGLIDLNDFYSSVS